MSTLKERQSSCTTIPLTTESSAGRDRHAARRTANAEQCETTGSLGGSFLVLLTIARIIRPRSLWQKGYSSIQPDP